VFIYILLKNGGKYIKIRWT